MSHDNNQYKYLDPSKIVETIDRLSQRIKDRFPDSGLYKVCRQLYQTATQAKDRSEWISRPFILLRVLTVVIILGVVILSVYAAQTLKLKDDIATDTVTFIQVLEAGINDLIFIAIAIFFLFTLETRIKRRRALTAIHEIRAIAHIIDMHQLTKDPERIRSKLKATKFSPQTRLTPVELGRYLDYCSEMLSLTGKIAALYVQHFDDAVAIASTNEVEHLCTGLSRKIWQKIMILQTLPFDASQEARISPG